MQKTKLIIADDHPLFRSGVRSELESIEHFEILAETGDGLEALQLIKQLEPHVAVLDFEMPGINGLEIAGQLSSTNIETAIILLTMHRDKKIFYKALDNGVNGYVLKDDAVMDIINAIDTVMAGKHFISSALSEVLIEKAKNQSGDHKIINLLRELTTTEKTILTLVAELKSNQEIANALCISKRTVENHKVNITSKLGLESSRHLLKLALQNKDFIL